MGGAAVVAAATTMPTGCHYSLLKDLKAARIRA